MMTMSEIPAQLRRLSEVLQSKTGSVRCWQAVGRDVKKQWPKSHSTMSQRSRHFLQFVVSTTAQSCLPSRMTDPFRSPKVFSITSARIWTAISNAGGEKKGFFKTCVLSEASAVLSDMLKITVNRWKDTSVGKTLIKWTGPV